MTPPDPQSLARLRTLLHDSGLPADEQVAALAAERQRLASGTELVHEQLAAELRWLQRQPGASDPRLGAELLLVRREWLALRLRGLAAASGSDPAILFDLAEVQADAACEGEPGLVQLAAEAIGRRVAGATADARLHEEATERVAALLASVEDASLRHQIEMLRRHGQLLASLAERTGSKPCRRFSRRLLRAADDRELARRLEGVLGRRGVVVLETTNFVLLLVVLTTLVLETVMVLTPEQAMLLQWVDAAACAFFIADFCFELSLHPRRGSWFLRNAVTDLLPAIPSVLFLLPGVVLPGAAGDVVVLRLVRLLRVTWAARYVQALRPLLRSARLLLFLVRGMDGLVQRFTQLLNREFVFVPAAAEVRRRVADDDRRDLLFESLRREHELVELLSAGPRAAVLEARATAAAAIARELGPARGVRLRSDAAERDVPIERAIEQLWALRPQDVGRWLRPSDVRALDRVLRVLAVPPVRWLPIVRWFVVYPLPASAEERIVGLSRRVAEWLESWHGRFLFYADLHGIVTGPQILDRVAGAMVKATQRPAVRLLLIGGLLSLLNWSEVSVPVLVFGGICLGILSLGLWLKRIAGEASEGYRLTSEAHFISQLERLKQHHESVDLQFLGRRVFGDATSVRQVAALVRAQLANARTGVPVPDREASEVLRLDCNRLALLYLHFLDGAPLHIGDVKTTEQLLANQSLENLRTQFLRVGKRDRKRLRKLKLDDGSVFSGPYLWFRFITESIAVESAKRIDGYSRFCVPLAERDVATPEQLAAMQDWLQRRSDPKGGRTLAERRPGRSSACATTEFTALDFVAADPERDRHLGAMFGDEVLQVVQLDRRTMLREIFGTRPVHHLPKSERSFNPLRFYQRRLSHGRVLFAPLLLLWRFVRSIGWLVVRIRQIVREVFDPELAMQRREAGTAPFAVALRKIHRMKAPGLLEAIRMRLQLDPAYSGAAAGWTAGAPSGGESDLESDIGFLHLHERQGVELRDRATEVRRAVAELHAAVAWLPAFPEPADAAQRAAAELAVTSAWIVDKDDVRTLLVAERWRAEVLPELLAAGERGSWLANGWRAVRSLFVVSVVDRWLETHGRGLPAGTSRVLHHAYARNVHEVRAVFAAWSRLPPETSAAATAIARLRSIYAHGSAIRRDLLALRAIQSMTVLDIRNYRDLVFRLGDYGADGEDPRLGTTLP